MTKKLSQPRAWKNTYFWIGGIMLLVALWGLIKGSDAIRDPGQTDEPGLVLIYLLAAVVMLVNGYVSHRQYVQHYEEESGVKTEPTSSSLADLIKQESETKEEEV